MQHFAKQNKFKKTFSGQVDYLTCRSKTSKTVIQKQKVKNCHFICRYIKSKKSYIQFISSSRDRISEVK